MESPVFNIILFQQECEQWKAKVEFYQNETKVLNRYLQEIIEKNADSNTKKEIKQFQQTLSEKMEISYELMDAINVHEEMLRETTSPGDFAGAAHALVKQTVTDFFNSYESFKGLFVRFLATAGLIV